MKGLRIVVLVILLLALVGTQTAWAGSNSCKCVHKVRKGDTMYWIANHYGITVRSLAKWNNIKNTKKIYPGQKLCVPCKPRIDKKVSKSGCRKVYRVKRGDTLYSIASRYCSTVKAIANKNHIKHVNLIYPGQRLCIPKKPYYCWGWCDP
jgi:LysM repeat protein